MRKWTVRVEDDDADTFTDFCRVNGVTAQGLILAAIRLTNANHVQHERTPVEAWPQESLNVQRGVLVAVAREIDAERRGRKTT